MTYGPDAHSDCPREVQGSKAKGRDECEWLGYPNPLRMAARPTDCSEDDLCKKAHSVSIY